MPNIKRCPPNESLHTQLRKAIVQLIMDPACSRNNHDKYGGTTKVLLEESNVDDKTDVIENMSSVTDEQQTDGIERDDFDAENRILDRCSAMMVKNKLESNSKNIYGSSSNFASTSRSETVSYSNNNSSYPSIPGTSNSDSNETIRNMMFCKPVFSLEVTSKSSSRNISELKSKKSTNAEMPTKKREIIKPDFMQRLLCSNVEEKKIFPKGKLYKAENCEFEDESDGMRANSDPASSSSGSVIPTTSNADKLLGLDKMVESETSKASGYYYDEDDEEEEPDDDTDDECTCLSSHEDDEEEEDSRLDERLWRKRRLEQPPLPQTNKRLCPDGSMYVYDSNWPANHSGSSYGSPGSSVYVHCSPEMKQWLSRFQSWQNNEKIQALDNLISCSEPSHLRHMMKTIEPLLQRDFISLLPKELALTVLGYLQPKDLLRAAQTCRYWRFLADDHLLWKEQCRRIGITKLNKIPHRLSVCVSPWKAAYIRQYLIENNWLYKKVTNAMVMRGHDDHVITCLQFYGNRILSGSDDTTLKVWSAITGKCLRTLVGHSGGVWSSQMVGNLVISGSTDRTLRVWNARSGKCLKVLAGHTSTVRCMHLHENRVVSGSRDATLRVWSILDGRCLRVLVGHLAAVRCVQYNGSVIVSGAYDYLVKVWNPHTGECLHTLAGHSNRVYSLQFDGVHIVSGSLDTSIRVWDVKSGQLKHTLTGHHSLTSGMELFSNVLISGNADSTVKVWDINSGQCIHTLSGIHKHHSAVTCLQTSNRFVITSSDDGTVKLWDVRTGKFIRNLVELRSRGSGGVVWRIKASSTKLICAVGSRNGTEDTKLLLLNFDLPGACRKCNE